jgi:hypothetical protein
MELTWNTLVKLLKEVQDCNYVRDDGDSVVIDGVLYRDDVEAWINAAGDAGGLPQHRVLSEPKGE